MLDQAPVFGVAGAIISEGVYVVGTRASNLLYTFRPRATGWAALTTPATTTDVSTTTAISVQTAKAGTGIAMDGNTTVVGARDFDGRGAVFVYTDVDIPSTDTNGLTAQAVLQSTGGRLGDQFGTGVGISGDTLIVGAPKAGDDGRGRAFLFRRVGNAWQQVKELSAPDSMTFGTSVAIDGTTAIVGAAAANKSYVYAFNGGDWVLMQTLSNQHGNFGAAVAIDGD